MLNQDFRDMLLCLKEAGVDFMIVGAYALAAHGFPRATGEIDIWVRNSSDNATRVMSPRGNIVGQPARFQPTAHL